MRCFFVTCVWKRPKSLQACVLTYPQSCKYRALGRSHLELAITMHQSKASLKYAGSSEKLCLVTMCACISKTCCGEIFGQRFGGKTVETTFSICLV